MERADRDRRVDRVAPNESSVAHLRAELWPETCFCPYGALVERADRDRRVDRDAPNQRSVAQLRAELLPETCFGPEVFFIILPPFINHDRGLPRASFHKGLVHRLQPSDITSDQRLLGGYMSSGEMHQ